MRTHDRFNVVRHDVNGRKDRLLIIQAGIVKAIRAKNINKVAKRQRKRISSIDAIVEAVDQAETMPTYGKTFGKVDDIWITDEQRLQAAIDLQRIIDKPKRYHPRQGYKVKYTVPGTLVQRDFVMPQSIDRAVQYVYWLATDPVVEEMALSKDTLDIGSYGYREGRSASEGVHLLYHHMVTNYVTHYFKTDLSAVYMDLIASKDSVLNRPGDVLRKAWITAGVVGVVDTVNPMSKVDALGGPLAPIRCNAACNGMESYRVKHRPINYQWRHTIKVIRYGGERVVVYRQSAGMVDVGALLEQYGVVLNQATTTSGALTDGIGGVAFLGWDRRRVIRKSRKNPVMGCSLLPTEESIKAMKAIIRHRTSVKGSPEELVSVLNPRREAWSKYYSTSRRSSKTLEGMTKYLLQHMKCKSIEWVLIGGFIPNSVKCSNLDYHRYDTDVYTTWLAAQDKQPNPYSGPITCYPFNKY